MATKKTTAPAKAAPEKEKYAPPKAPAKPEQKAETLSAKDYFAGLPDAPVSHTVHWVDVQGFDHMTTIRAYTTAHMLQLLDKFLLEAKKFGISPIASSNGHQAPSNGQVNGMRPDQGSFVVEGALVLKFENGKTYAKLRGGKFRQHGVTIWYEPLVEAGLIESEEEFMNFDPRNPLDLTGWTAIFDTKPGEKYAIPTKVVKLLPPE